MNTTIGANAKYLLAVGSAVLLGLISALDDGHISTDDAVKIGIVFLGAILTWVVPNLPDGPGKYLKLVVQALTAGAVILQSALVDGVSAQEWLQIAAAVLGAFTVYAIPNYNSASQTIGTTR